MKEIFNVISEYEALTMKYGDFEILRYEMKELIEAEESKRTLRKREYLLNKVKYPEIYESNTL